MNGDRPKLSSEEKDRLLKALIRYRGVSTIIVANSLGVSDDTIIYLRNEYPYGTRLNFPQKNNLNDPTQRNMVRTMLRTMSPLQIRCMCGDSLDEICKLQGTKYERERLSPYENFIL